MLHIERPKEPNGLFLLGIDLEVDQTGWWNKFYLVFYFDMQTMVAVSGVLKHRKIRISKKQWLELSMLIK